MAPFARLTQIRSSSATVTLSDDCAIASRLNASTEAAMGNATELADRWAARVVDDDDDASRPPSPAPSPDNQFDVFINHRGVDTKHNVAHLLYEKIELLSGGTVRSFLDNQSMRPGDKLQESIDKGIEQCRIAVAIFSRRYFDSDFCLHELASIVKLGKLLIPIFYGIKPSELVLPQKVIDSGIYSSEEIESFKKALREARYTVGLTYDPDSDDMVELVSKAANAVMDRIREMGQRVRVPPQPQRRQIILSRL